MQKHSACVAWRHLFITLINNKNKRKLDVKQETFLFDKKRTGIKHRTAKNYISVMI